MSNKVHCIDGSCNKNYSHPCLCGKEDHHPGLKKLFRAIKGDRMNNPELTLKELKTERVEMIGDIIKAYLKSHELLMDMVKFHSTPMTKQDPDEKFSLDGEVESAHNKQA